MVFHVTSPSVSVRSGQITGIALGVPAGLIFCLVLFFLGVLYHRGLAIRRKRAMRRYLESGEVRLQKRSALRVALMLHLFLSVTSCWSRQSFEPLGPGEKGTKVHARILRPSELKKFKPLGSGVFGTVNKVLMNLTVSMNSHWLSIDSFCVIVSDCFGYLTIFIYLFSLRDFGLQRERQWRSLWPSRPSRTAQADRPSLRSLMWESEPLTYLLYQSTDVIH